MLGSKVGIDHFWMRGHRPVVTLCDDLAAREDRDVIESSRRRSSCARHEHRAVCGYAADERRDALHVRVRHAGGRLVEEHHFRIQRERGRDLERALAP